MYYYENGYGHLVGFFLGEFQYFEKDKDAVDYFRENRLGLSEFIEELTHLLKDSSLDWKKFSDEANIYFSSKDEFLKYMTWLRDELMKL